MKHPRFHFSHQKRARKSGFTLIEILAASIACAMILVAIYGIFSHAIRLRDQATARAHEAQLRSRAAQVIRNDLQNAYISGGVLAATLQGSDQGIEPRFPGYLKFTTTTGKDTDDELRGDVQAVSYYVVENATNPSRDSGMLVRAIDRNLLARVHADAREEQLLANVSSIEVSFFDGTNWSDTWSFTPGSNILPEAVRVRINQVPASNKSPNLPPLEILAPWTAQPLTSGTTSTDSGSTLTSASTSTATAQAQTDDEEETVPAQQEGEIAGEPNEMVGQEGVESTDQSGTSPTPTGGNQ